MRLTLATITLLITVAGCAAHHLPDSLSGLVVEKGSGAPVEGVYLVYVWEKTTSLHRNTVCAYVSTSRSDSAGRYQFEDWGGLPGQRADSRALYRVYAPGYQVVSFGPGPVVIERDKSPADDRLNALELIAFGTTCFEKGPTSGLAQMFRAIAQEAERLGGPKGLRIAAHYNAVAVATEETLKYSSGRMAPQREAR